jgi:hypothetical protein
VELKYHALLLQKHHKTQTRWEAEANPVISCLQMRSKLKVERPQRWSGCLSEEWLQQWIQKQGSGLRGLLPGYLSSQCWVFSTHPRIPCWCWEVSAAVRLSAILFPRHLCVCVNDIPKNCTVYNLGGSLSTPAHIVKMLSKSQILFGLLMA